MKTWEIRNGDVALNLEGRVNEINGPYKVIQDVKNWLLNYKGYNKFHPELGSTLEDFVGQPISPDLISLVRETITNILNDYIDNQMEDLQQRIEETGDPYLAIGQAEPSSMVLNWTHVQVVNDYDSIVVNIGFRTYTNDIEEVVFSLSNGIERTRL